MNRPLLFLVIAALGLGAACGLGPMPQEHDGGAMAGGDPSGPAVPAFKLQDLDGNQFTNADIEGKVVLLNFWATWCGPCKIEMPWFVEFQRKYKDRGFTVMAVSLDEDGWDPVREFAEALEFNFPVLLGSEAVSDDFGGIMVLPTTLIVNQAGQIVATHQGLVAKARYEEEIEALLDSPAEASL